MNFIPRVLAVVLTALSLWSPPGSALAQAPQRSVLRHLVGDLALEGRTRGDGSMTVAAADARTSVVVTFLALDLRRWSDSATRMLAARPRRGSIVTWEASVTGPGVTAGSMSMARTITPSETTVVLLVTDTAFHAVRTALSMDDARALAAAMKRAADASLPTRPAPLPKAKAVVPPPKGTTPPPKKPPQNTESAENARIVLSVLGVLHLKVFSSLGFSAKLLPELIAHPYGVGHRGIEP